MKNRTYHFKKRGGEEKAAALFLQKKKTFQEEASCTHGVPKFQPKGIKGKKIKALRNHSGRGGVGPDETRSKNLIKSKKGFREAHLGKKSLKRIKRENTVGRGCQGTS